MTVSFSTLDLNLLRVFDAVMEECSVLRASQKVCISQSAVSHSLARLREMLDDELFIRTTAGMQPTARAMAVAGIVRDALKSLEAAIELPKFEPATSTRKFTIAASDFTTMVLASRLLHVLRTEAPHVDLAIKPVTRIDLAEQIDLGRIDAAIGTFQREPSRFKSDFLFEYDDVLITHASQRLGVVTAEILAGIPIIVVSFGGEQGCRRGFHRRARRSEMYDWVSFERAMSASKQAARIAISLPHFLALPGRTVQGYRQSFRARSAMPSPVTSRLQSMSFPIPPLGSKCARSGTSATKATHRTISQRSADRFGTVA